MIDPLQLLIKIAKEKHIHKKWTGQPLELIKILPNSSKGDLGESFILEYSRAIGLKVDDKRSRLGDYDLGKMKTKKELAKEAWAAWAAEAEVAAAEAAKAAAEAEGK